MKHIKVIKITVLVFLVLALTTVAVIWLGCKDVAEGLNGTEKTITINLRDEGSPLFLRAKVWGIAGNHEQIVLSQFNNDVPNKTDDYIFYTDEIFYKVENNTLIVYAAYSSISEPVSKIPNVIVKALKTGEDILDYSANYQKYGLERIRTYDEPKSR